MDKLRTLLCTIVVVTGCMHVGYAGDIEESE